MHHDYHTLLWEYKELRVEIMLRGELDRPCKNCRNNSEGDTYEDKRKKYEE